MKNFKKCASRLLSLTIAAIMALSVGLNASAAVINYKWTVDWSSRDYYNWIGWKGNGNTKFSVDSSVHTDNSWYSIKLENTKFDISCVARTYNVEPYSTYKFSALVKYSGYQLDPNADAPISGACIGLAPYYNGSATVFSYQHSSYASSSDWTLLEYEFTTGNETTYNLCLQNGNLGIECKGTAWFSDVKLEKAEMTNSWNILAVFFKNSDATVTIDGKRVHHTLSLRESDITDINTLTLDKLPETLKTISKNKLTVNSIDRYYVDEPLTEKDLTTYQDGYCIDETNPVLLSKVLDKYLAQKHYNQILVYVPFHGINGNWWGLGGTKYKGIQFAQITNSWEGAFEIGEEYNGKVTVHEICHGLEADSKALNDHKTVDFHEMYNYPEITEYEWHIRYMNDTLPDGKKGVEPVAFYRTSGNYTLVDNDMTTGVGISPSSSSVTPPAPKKIKVETVEDNKVMVSWDAVPGVSGYQLVLFKDASYKEIWTTFDCGSETTSMRLSPITKNIPYYYGVRAVYSQGGTAVYSDWTYLTFTHAGTDILFGDIDNNGAFGLSDIIAALRIYVNGTAADQRTLSAAGISGRTELRLSDVINLLNKYVNS